MTKGCVWFLAAYVGAAVAFYFPIASRNESTLAAVGLAALAAFGVLIILGAFSNIVKHHKLRRAFDRAEHGFKPADNEMTVVTGTVEPLGEILASPLMGLDCVAYDYKVSRVVRSGSDSSSNEESAAAGMAWRPYLVRSQIGAVRMLGAASVDRLPTRFPDSPDDFERARAFLDHHAFEFVGALQMPLLLSRLVRAYGSEADELNLHWRLQQVDDLNDWTLSETVIQPGDTITAVGHWDEERNGLRPFIELTAGDRRDARRALLGSMGTTIVVGFIVGAVILFGIGLYIATTPTLVAAAG